MSSLIYVNICYRSFSTLKGELLPYIISKQLFKPIQSIDDKNTSMVQVDLKQDIFRFVNKRLSVDAITKWSIFNDHYIDLEEAYYADVIRCYAYVSDKKIGLRANTVQMYHLANAKVEVIYLLQNLIMQRGNNIYV